MAYKYVIIISVYTQGSVGCHNLLPAASIWHQNWQSVVHWYWAPSKRKVALTGVPYNKQCWKPR